MTNVIVRRTVEDVCVNLVTTSSKIRALLAEGYNRSEVSKILEIRYQHVRNVELMPIKKQK